MRFLVLSQERARGRLTRFAPFHFCAQCVRSLKKQSALGFSLLRIRHWLPPIILNVEAEEIGDFLVTEIADFYGEVF